MALNLANVDFNDTFNTFRLRTNSIIGEAVSATSTTSQTITSNVEFSGTVTIPTLNATTISATGTVSAGDFSGNGALITSVLRSDAATTKTSGDLTFNDNVKAVFGTGSDLEIYHDASDSIINDAGTGNIKIQTGGTDRVEVTGGGGSLYGTWTVTEGLTVDGPAVFNGNTTIIQSTVIETTDGLIHLASNNEVSDTLDIGFFGHYFNGVANQHAGVIRDSGTKEFYIFNEYSPGFEPENDIDIENGSFALANVHAAFFKGDGSQLTNAGASVDTGTNNADLFVPFTGISSGVMVTANVNSNFTFNPSTGQANATDFNSTSDERFKSNVTIIDNAVDKVMKLDGVYFDWIANGQHSMGLVAQQIEDIVPEVVSTDNKGFKSVSYGKLVGLLVEAIKEQQEAIEKLKS